jgi:hypothetical protein
MNGKILVRILIQFRASRSGAISMSGKEGWCRKTHRRDVIARISVSRFSGALSRVRRISAGEKRLNTSSVDSGSSQNYKRQFMTITSNNKPGALLRSSKDHQQGYPSLPQV